MARFITNGSTSCKGTLMINTDYIEMARGVDDHTLEITMVGGRTIRTSAFFWHNISGWNVIRQVIPVKNVVAMFRPKNEDAYEVPVHAMVVTESGDLRPVDIEDSWVEFMDDYSGYAGIRVDGEIISGGKNK